MRKQYFILIIVSMLFGEMVNAQSPLIFDNVNIHELQSEDHLPSSTIQTIYQYFLDHEYKTPNESELRDMPRNSSIPTNFEEIYYDHVWLNIAEYCWLDGDHYSNADNSSVALQIPDRTHGGLRLLFDNVSDQYRHVIDARVMKPFDGEPLVMTKVKNNYYLVKKGDVGKADAEYQLIVDYRDGLLIYENTFSGKPGDFTTFRRFRFAALPIPKSLLEETNLYNMPVIASSVPLMQFDTKNGGWTPHQKRLSGSTQPANSGRPVYQSKPAVIHRDELDEEIEPEVINARPQVVGEMFSEEELNEMRPGKKISSGLESALYEKDWIEIGGLMWYQGESYWVNDHVFPVFRFGRDGGVSEFEMDMNTSNNRAPKFVATTSDDQFNVERRGNFTFITNSGENGERTEYTVLLYNGSMLVVDEFDAISGIRVRKVWKAA